VLSAALTAAIILKLPQQGLLPAHQVHQKSSAATATLINNKNSNNQPDDLTQKTPTKRALPLPKFHCVVSGPDRNHHP
jgi:hypothetical protein